MTFSHTNVKETQEQIILALHSVLVSSIVIKTLGEKKSRGKGILVGFQYQLATAHHGGGKHCSRNMKQSRAERTGSLPRLPRLYNLGLPLVTHFPQQGSTS